MAQPVRIAVAGFGLVGRRHAAAIAQAPGLALAGIADPSASARAEATERGEPVFAELGALIAGARPDGIVLATPTPLHLAQGLECIAAGCPVLVEKPIAATPSEGRVLVDAARAAGVPLLVGHHRRHNGLIRAAKTALDAGSIGEVRAVQATCWFYKPDHYFAAAPWRTRAGAGPISINLVHDVDLLRHFCGEVAAVRAVAVPSRRGFENEDLASAILRFASGSVATITVSDSIVSPWSWEMTSGENPAYPVTGGSCYLIGGSEGALSLPDLRVWRQGVPPDWWAPMTTTRLDAVPGDPLAHQMTHFARVIAGGEAPLVSGEEGLRALEVVAAVAEAARTGGEVLLPRLDARDARTGESERA